MDRTEVSIEMQGTERSVCFVEGTFDGKYSLKNGIVYLNGIAILNTERTECGFYVIDETGVSKIEGELYY